MSRSRSVRRPGGISHDSFSSGGSQMTSRHPTIHTTSLGPRTRRVVRSVARFVNPVTLQVAGRPWMPIVGILHHRGRSSGRAYATPLGLRRLGDRFVMPRTFGEDAAWYRDVLPARGGLVTFPRKELPLARASAPHYPTCRPAV